MGIYHKPARRNSPRARQYLQAFFLLVGLLASSSCQPAAALLTSTPPAVIAASPTLVLQTATSTPIPTTLAATVEVPPTLPASKPVINFTPFPPPAATLQVETGQTLEGHDVVLFIHNVDKLTGRADQFPLRWLAWGAPAFTITPDGSFWFIDVTNRQYRLVHIAPSGNLLETVPIQAHLMTDIAANQDFVWVVNHNNYGAVEVIQIERLGLLQRTSPRRQNISQRMG